MILQGFGNMGDPVGSSPARFRRAVMGPVYVGFMYERYVTNLEIVSFDVGRLVEVWFVGISRLLQVVNGSIDNFSSLSQVPLSSQEKWQCIVNTLDPVDVIQCWVLQHCQKYHMLVEYKAEEQISGHVSDGNRAGPRHGWQVVNPQLMWSVWAGGEFGWFMCERSMCSFNYAISSSQAWSYSDIRDIVRFNEAVGPFLILLTFVHLHTFWGPERTNDLYVKAVINLPRCALFEWLCLCPPTDILPGYHQKVVSILHVGHEQNVYSHMMPLVTNSYAFQGFIIPSRHSILLQLTGFFLCLWHEYTFQANNTIQIPFEIFLLFNGAHSVPVQLPSLSFSFACWSICLLAFLWFSAYSRALHLKQGILWLLA